MWLFGEILFGCLAIDFLTKRELRLQVIRYRSRIDALPDPGDLGELDSTLNSTTLYDRVIAKEHRWNIVNNYITLPFEVCCTSKLNSPFTRMMDTLNYQKGMHYWSRNCSRKLILAYCMSFL